MRARTAALSLLPLLCVAPSARAALLTADNVPAATLLLPYFEVDLTSANGVTTLFSINNASATAVLAHVVVWSDLSVPVFDFNLYLTGYDVQSFNLRDLIEKGILPQTAPTGQDPGDTISPQGAFSQDLDFASCASLLPPLTTLPRDFLDHLQASLTGHFSNILGGCAGLDHGDWIARGYVTADTVSNCSLRFPGDSGYFVAGGKGDATDQNVLWGDVTYLNPAERYSQASSLVHIEASATAPETSVSGQYTFYGRYVSWTAADNREPLTAAFAATFLHGGAFDARTSFVVWRDSKVVQGAFSCGTLPSWYPLGQEGIVFFDEQEHPAVAPTFPFSPQPPEQGIVPFPAEAQSTLIGGLDFPVPISFGWVYLDLNTAVAAAGPNPPEDPTSAQAWVTLLMEDAGRFSVGFNALRIPRARPLPK